VFSLASLFILFDLLRRTIQTLGSSDLEQLLRVELLSSLRTSFRSTLRQALFEKYLSERLAGLGFARLYTAEKEKNHPTEYKLKRLGRIVAVDPAPLKRISQKLNLTPLPRERNTSSVLVYRPEDDAPYVTVQPHGNVKKKTRLALLTKEQTPSKQIARLIHRAFIIQKTTKSTLDWQCLRQLISSAIAKHETTTVRSVANALENIVDDYLETQLVVSGQDHLLLEDFIGDVVYGFKPPNVSELRLSDSAVEAARTGSQDCLDELFNCIYKLAQIALQKQNKKYFRDWIFHFYWSYHSFGPHAKGSDFNIAPDITRRMHWLSDLLSMEIHNHENSCERIKTILPYSIHYLSLCLHMLKISSERCDQLTFDAVIEHLANFLKYKLGDVKQILDTYRSSNNFMGVPPELKLSDKTAQEELLREYDQLCDHKNLVYVIAGAWLMHNVKAKGLQSEKMDSSLIKLIENAPDFRGLLDLYAMPGMADMTTSHDNSLGFDGWDWPHSHYPKVRCGTDFQRWISTFYQFLLLKKATGLCIDLDHIRQTQMASHESLKNLLTQISNNGYSLPAEYQGRPWGIEARDLENAKEQIKKVLAFWQKQQG